MGGALCDVGGTGSPSARGRAVRRSWRISTCERPGPRGPRIRGREWISPVPHSPDADGRHRLVEAGGTAVPAALPVNVIDVAPAGPTITLGQLGYDHALVVVRGEISVEFLRGVRQHLTSLVEAGVRYVVVNLAEVTACPPQMVGELAAACRALHARQGWLRLIATAPCVVSALESAAVEDLFPIYRAARTEFREVS
jgi:anti-anti-sigma regulatory factor